MSHQPHNGIHTTRRPLEGASHPHKDAAGVPPRKLQVRFACVFLSLILVFAVLTATPLAQRLLHDPLSRLIAQISAAVLSLFGSVSVWANDISFNGFTASVVEACNGVLPSYIYVSAVLAFPSGWRDRAKGILIGIPAILALNVFRVVTLMFCGAYWPTILERVHIYVWQALVVALSLALWVFWAERFVRPGLRTNAEARP